MLSDSTKSELQELKAAIEALNTEVKTSPGAIPQPEQGRGNRWSSGRGQGRREVRPRPPKCSKCLAKGEQWCNHCFKCGSDSHYAIGCRYRELSGQKPLNGNRLLVREQKSPTPHIRPKNVTAVEKGHTRSIDKYSTEWPIGTHWFGSQNVWHNGQLNILF